MRQGAPAVSGETDLLWAEEFFRGAREHIFAREEDGVLILPPNQVYKANSTGIALVRYLTRGGRIDGLTGLDREDRRSEVRQFLEDVRALYAGDTTRIESRGSVEMVPYTPGFTRLPILGEIAVTYRCNNSCLFCYAGCGTGGCGGAAASAAGGPEMSRREIERVISTFAREARIPFFSFTGGEPLLRRDLEEMIRFARKLSLQVNLITNATRADRRRAHSLFAAGLGTAQVSIEGPEEATHDLLTAREGSFRRTLAGIACLQAAGISVQTNTTLTALNAAHATRMPAFLRGLGIKRFAMNMYIPVPGAARAPELFLPYAGIGEVIEAVRREARAAGMVFYWYSPVPHCSYNPVARGLGNKSCAAMDGLLSVSPSGDVLPCSSYAKPMGNLLRDRFEDIWFSDEARHFKNKLYAPEECEGCASFMACQAACPLYWQYAGTKEIRACR